MKRSASVVLTVGLMLGAHSAFAQDLSRYRDYVLGTTLESIVAASGANSSDARTIHLRPAAIQQLPWRAPYVASTSARTLPRPPGSAIWAGSGGVGVT